MNRGGDFIISWQSDGQDGANSGIYAQRYNSAGLALGGEFQVNSTTSNNQNNPSVALDNGGDFIITWESNNGTSYDIYGQRYNAAGINQGTEFLINKYTKNNQLNSSVAIDSTGNFTVTWQSYELKGANFDIFAQHYTNAGVKQGTEFQVNSYTKGDESNPSIAMDKSGDFIISWQQEIYSFIGYDVYAQLYKKTTTSIQPSSQFASSFNLYPNPAKDKIQLDLEGQFSVRIMDLSGHTLMEETQAQTVFNINGLDTGVYMVEVTKDGEKAKKKLV